jgi:voltage-dependent anion channel protein 2
MAFLPPLFSKIGSQTKDLLSKKYDYKNQLTVKGNVQSDLTLESTVVLSDGKDGKSKSGDINGSVKAKYKNKDFGELEGEIGTSGTLTGELKATKLADGLTVSIKGTERPQAKVTAEYKQDSVAASIGVTVESATNKVEPTLVVGADNFSVGGQVEYDTAAGDLSDYNFGAEFSQKDYTLSLKTQQKATVLVGSYFYNITQKNIKLRTQIGAQVDWNLKSNDRVLALGTEHDVDETTTVKSRIDTNAQVAAVLEHRLTNPALKVGLSSQWNGRDRTTTPARFGVAFTFGDF